MVVSFILEHETQEQIALALNHLKTWNPSWNPKFFMTDYSHAEMSALEECFAGKESGTILNIVLEIAALNIASFFIYGTVTSCTISTSR